MSAVTVRTTASIRNDTRMGIPLVVGTLTLPPDHRFVKGEPTLDSRGLRDYNILVIATDFLGQTDMEMNDLDTEARRRTRE